MSAMNAVSLPALLVDAGLPVFLAVLTLFCATALLIVRVRLRSVRNALKTQVRELRSAREDIEALSRKKREFEEKFQAIFDNSLSAILALEHA